jgi:hypothetical protein
VKIALCVSVPNGGEELLKILVDSAARLASGRHEIGIDFTCHGEAQRRSTENCGLKLPVSRAHIVPREKPRYFHAASVTHSRCVNALFASVDADVAVICDFDMAFVHRHWDELLIERVAEQGMAFFGTPYAADAGLNFRLPQISVFARKYQGKPNCMFVGFSPQRLRSISDLLCDFASTFDDEHSIPIKFISTPAESRCFGLPVGSFLHIDTGSRIPQLIERHGLTHRMLERRVKNYAVLKSARFPENYSAFLYPEEYLDQGVPFIAHFRKGASKSADDSYGPNLFRKDIDVWIDALLEKSCSLVTAEKNA